jgi:hypothetical protein
LIIRKGLLINKMVLVINNGELIIGILNIIGTIKNLKARL